MEVLLTNIENKFAEFVREAELRAERGNKTAGARSRKASLELTALLKEWRKLSVKN